MLSHLRETRDISSGSSITFTFGIKEGQKNKADIDIETVNERRAKKKENEEPPHFYLTCDLHFVLVSCHTQTHTTRYSTVRKKKEKKKHQSIGRVRVREEAEEEEEEEDVDQRIKGVSLLLRVNGHDGRLRRRWNDRNDTGRFLPSFLSLPLSFPKSHFEKRKKQKKTKGRGIVSKRRGIRLGLVVESSSGKLGNSTHSLIAAAAAAAAAGG